MSPHRCGSVTARESKHLAEAKPGLSPWAKILVSAAVRNGVLGPCVRRPG